jgi:hypothetical protein
MDQTMGPNDKQLEDAEEWVIRDADAIAEYIFGQRAPRKRVMLAIRFRVAAACCRAPCSTRQPLDNCPARRRLGRLALSAR